MSDRAFVAVLAGVVTVSLGIGWMIGERSQPLSGGRPDQPSGHLFGPLKPLDAHFHRFDPNGAPAAPAMAEDDAPGWRDREALRDHLSTAINRLEGAPCQADTRAEFLNAFAERAIAISADFPKGHDDQGPAYWRTAEDQSLDRRIGELTTGGYVTDDEIARAVLSHAPGPLGALTGPAIPPPAPTRAQSVRCGAASPPPQPVAFRHRRPMPG